MLANGLTLAILTTSGFVIVYQKLPRRVRKWIERHSLLADIVALMFTYSFLGGTLVALVAAALVGLFTSALLYIANHPDDFMYLYDMSRMVKKQLNELKHSLNKFGADYKAHKELENV